MSAVYPKNLPKPPLKVQEKVVPSKVKYKKPKQKSLLKEIAQGYSAATTLHGFQYLGESGVHFLERYRPGQAKVDLFRESKVYFSLPRSVDISLTGFF